MQDQAQTIAGQIEETEALIKDSKLKIDRKNQLLRLEKNRDFKAIIGEGYLREHAIRQVMLKSHPGLQQESAKFAVDSQLNGIGALKQFFVAIMTEGVQAEASLENEEASLEELLAEQNESAGQ